MTIFLTILHVIFCLVLIVVILIQGGRGQGLSGPSFSSGNVQSLFGTQAADFLTKATSISAICFLITASALNILESRKNRSLLEGPSQSATGPIDVDAIKKALEKVKAESAQTTENATTATDATAQAVSDSAAAVTVTADASQSQAEAAALSADASAKEAAASVPA